MGGGGIEHGHPIRVRETNHYRCPPSPRTAGQPLMTIFPVAWSPAAGARSSRKGLPSSVVPTRPLPFVVSEKPAAPSFPLNQSRTVAGSAGLSKSTVTAPPLSPLASTARSEEHPSELQSLMRTSYAVFCLTTNNQH